MPIAPVVVDAHSHIFNAEDLPIDGFLKELFPLPKFLTSLASGPLDALASWVAPGASNETQAIVRLLTGTAGGFTVGVASPWATGSDLGYPEVDSDSAAGGFTIQPATDASVDLVARVTIATTGLTPVEQAELDAWFQEWGGSEVELVVDGEDAGLSLPVFLNPRKVTAAVRRFIAALQLITRYRHLIASKIATTYPEVRLYVPALVDFTAATNDRPATMVRDQIAVHSLVAKLSAAGKLPGAKDTRIHPLVGFDPLYEVQNSLLGLWKASEGFANPYVPFAGVTADPAEQDRYRRGIPFDRTRAFALKPLKGTTWNDQVPDLDGVVRSLDMVRYAVEQGGFAGVKIYPPAGFLPLGNRLRFPGDLGEQLDVAMRVLYTYCVANDVPILTHAAHSNGFKGGYNDLAGPAGWELVLQEFPTLRVCLGHFGHLHGVGDDTAHPREHSWPMQFLALIDKYDNVYADVGNSKVPAVPAYREQFGRMLKAFLDGSDAVHAKRRKRLLYGSDWWMNNLAPKHDQFFSSFRELMDLEFDSATGHAFMGLNALRWLGIIDDDAEVLVDNQNRRRLHDFYGPHQRPDWLGPEPPDPVV